MFQAAVPEPSASAVTVAKTSSTTAVSRVRVRVAASGAANRTGAVKAQPGSTRSVAASEVGEGSPLPSGGVSGTGGTLSPPSLPGTDPPGAGTVSGASNGSVTTGGVEAVGAGAPVPRGDRSAPVAEVGPGVGVPALVLVLLLELLSFEFVSS